jgi:hypothetical protein
MTLGRGWDHAPLSDTTENFTPPHLINKLPETNLVTDLVTKYDENEMKGKLNY